MTILNPKIFDADVKQAATRDGFGEGLLMAADENSNVVGLCADLTDSVKMEAFAKKFPDRFVEMGICEQSMASVASGMAAMGKIPFAASYAIFSPGRNWEQIRTTVCYNNSNVKIVGSHAGITVGEDGGSHQCLEDIALTRVLPNMTVLVPCDVIEAKKMTILAARMKGPVYLRLTRSKTPIITTEETPFEVGRSQLMRSPANPHVGIVGCGPLLYNILRAAEELEKEEIPVSVLNLSTIKPLDEAGILGFLESSGGRLVTVEEHQIRGGMGSAVAELLAKRRPAPVEFVGVDDAFGQSGTPAELIEHYGLGISAIKSAVRRVLDR